MTDHAELGRFLRARRARVRPADVGLPAGMGTRRTPGLRREELAALAGVSIDYYTRLERGKETRPSSAVLDALARALLLHEDEREHLRGLAERIASRAPDRRALPSRTVRPAILQLLETLRPNPAYVMSRTNDVLAANVAGLRLFAGMEDWPVRQRNTVRYMFLHPMARRLMPNWDQHACQSVAHLRAVAGTDPDAPDLAALVGELIVKSADFSRYWERYDVRLRAGGDKTFDHPDVGEMTLSYEVMALTRTEGQRLAIYQATPGSPAHDAMTLLDLTAAHQRAD